jgi:hypothetical protein
MLDFASLKGNVENSLETLSKELKNLNSNGYSNDDDRVWYPDVDKAGNGYAVIRFLPAPKGESMPYVRLFHYGFRGPTNAWFIENSPSTIGLPCPMMEYNSSLWNTGDEEKKKQARAQKRKQTFISNILVVSDTANPKNEGKVMLFKYGKKIFAKLNSAMNPEFPDEPKINPFCPWKGAHFKLRIRNVEGYRNYDESKFAEPSVLGTDAEIEAFWEQEYSLKEFVSEDKFKSWDELVARRDKVLGLVGNTYVIKGSGGSASPAPQPKKAAPAAIPQTVEDADDDDSGDDKLEFFKRLAKED